MTKTKKPNFRFWLGCLGMIIFIVFIAYTTASYRPPQPATAPPKPGFWRGTGVYFTITQAGEIESFFLQPTNAMVNGSCKYLQDFYPTLENGKLIAESGANKVDGFFAADGQFHGTYSITKCGQWIVSPPEEGSWDAGWVSDKAP